MSVRLPRLLDAHLNETARLHPSRLQAEISMMSVSRATMSLPEGEPAASMRQFVEIYGPHGSLGIFRVSALDTEYGGGRSVSLEHGLSVLRDGLTGEEEEISGTARQVLSKLLECQTARIDGAACWQLGQVDVPQSVEITLRGERTNLLNAALELLRQPGVSGRYMYTFDQSVFPWKLNLAALSQEDACEGRLGRNLESVRVALDESELATRVYADELEGGYIQEDSPYGTVSRTLSIPEGVSAQEYAREYLKTHAKPRTEIRLSAMDLAEATGEPFDRFFVGRLCRVPMPEYGVVLDERVAAIQYDDLMGNPDKVTVELSNQAEDTAYALARHAADLDSANRNLKKTNSCALSNAIRLTETELEMSRTKETMIRQNGEMVSQLNQVSIQLDANAAAIRLKASQQSVDELNKQMEEAEAELVVQSDRISTKVSKNGIISSINQTAESVKIQAGKIELEGYVTASQLESEMAMINNSFSKKVDTTNLNVQGKFTYRSQECTWKYIDVVTNVSIDVNKDSRWFVTEVNFEGTYSRSANVSYVTDVNVNYDTTQIRYMSF